MRRIRIEESAFFEGVKPDSLADEVMRISRELSRTFSIGGVRLVLVWLTIIKGAQPGSPWRDGTERLKTGSETQNLVVLNPNSTEIRNG